MSNKDLSPAEKRRMICDIQALGKKLLDLNGGKDITFTCADEKGDNDVQSHPDQEEDPKTEF